MKSDGSNHEAKHPLYEYVCESSAEFPLLHTHRIRVRQHNTGLQKWCTLVLLGGAVLVGFASKVEGVHWTVLAVALILVVKRRNRVEQESVVVMPTLGVQLETVYRSKHVKRRFVPLHRILWPVINEAVTPTTCFTYLALLLRDDSRLTLTFLHVRPPVAMLLPIWSALCGAAGQPPERSQFCSG